MDRQVTLEQVSQAAADTLKASIYICCPGAVVSYNAEAQLADVQPMTNDVRFDLDTGAVVFEPWSIVRAVPVAWPRFGKYVIAGPLAQNDPVVLQAFDLDPSPWRAQGRSTKPVNPADVRRLGGNYWRAIPTDLTGPMQDAGAMGTAFVLGVDGDPAQVRFTAGQILLGASAKQPVARAADPSDPLSQGDPVNAGYLVFATSSPLALATPPYYPGTAAGLAAAQAAVNAGAPNAFLVSLDKGTITGGSSLVLAG